VRADGGNAESEGMCMTTRVPDDPVATDLTQIVTNEAFLWGDNETDNYFAYAESGIDFEWSYIAPFLSRFPIDYSHTVDLACGHGRNSVKLSLRTDNLTLVDVNPENIAFCKRRFFDKHWKFILNNGFDLNEIADKSVTFIYCFDAAVHFDIEIIISYIKEFRRVLKVGGFGFVHHSNYTKNPGGDFRDHPRWRNFMSKDIFAHLCIHNGLDIIDQSIVDYGAPMDFPETDCFSLFRNGFVADAPLTKLSTPELIGLVLRQADQ
jgi:hypothetical protein